MFFEIILSLEWVSYIDKKSTHKNHIIVGILLVLLVFSKRNDYFRQQIVWGINRRD